MKKICVICNKEFEATRKNRKTCCDECSKALYKQTRNRNTKAYYERKMTDPEFVEKKRTYARNFAREKWQNDEGFREKRRAYQREYIAKKRAEGKVMDN